jgi:paired amphipathic helix protein Sin3a
VNKFKKHHARTPIIYRQFLEILQTYQRESTPIQDVYAQVTDLFKAAPDLIEDFEQFLPESAAQAKAQQNLARQGMNPNIPNGDQQYSPELLAHIQAQQHARQAAVYAQYQ